VQILNVESLLNAQTCGGLYANSSALSTISSTVVMLLAGFAIRGLQDTELK
jgi:hypothetical protein